MPRYREMAPPARLAQLVECFWVSEQDDGEATVQRVVPDGCADILYSRHQNRASLAVVGPMTHFVDHEQPAASSLIGVRFRPALWTAFLRLNAETVRDRQLMFEDLYPARARQLQAQLAETFDATSCVRVLADWLPTVTLATPVQRAVAALECSYGTLSLACAAKEAGLSTRHFRRLCLESTGLSPKLLARILRFRRASSLALQLSQPRAQLAVECGYCDQSHLIADFRRFSGRTPGTLAR